PRRLDRPGVGTGRSSHRHGLALRNPLAPKPALTVSSLAKSEGGKTRFARSQRKARSQSTFRDERCRLNGASRRRRTLLFRDFVRSCGFVGNVLLFFLSLTTYQQTAGVCLS